MRAYKRDEEVMIKNESNFASRHIGPRESDISTMLQALSLSSVDELIEKTVPKSIRFSGLLNLPEAISESALLEIARNLAELNEVKSSLIGLGFHETITPSVIQRNILENPCWYTQYTPYQAEIAQGRLEALINFQTMVSDLCGMKLANASLLDEGSAAAEAMSLSFRVSKKKDAKKFFVSSNVHPPTIEVLKTRAAPLGIELVIAGDSDFDEKDSYFGVLLQYPGTDGTLKDYSDLAARCKNESILVTAACDLLALCKIVSPGEWGADIAVGNSQRFGVPLGFGGPHAAFIATSEQYQREIPGRIVGVSKDSDGKPAYRLALQTREQHIRRERATSNICTAQVLLAIMASMYAVYHGPKGLRKIASDVHEIAFTFADSLVKLGFSLASDAFYDCVKVVIDSEEQSNTIFKAACDKGFNIRRFEDGSLGFSFSETSSWEGVSSLLEIFSSLSTSSDSSKAVCGIPQSLQRTSSFLEHPVFNSYHSETELLRYINRLQTKDLSLAVSMIPLGSCTMKLNATSEMAPVSMRGFSQMHPFAPESQSSGYIQLIDELKSQLAAITGLPAVSLQPNAGSQGEFAGLLAIRGYHRSRDELQRTVCLIPQSAHGTNPASAILAGMKVVSVACDEKGNIDVDDLRLKATEHTETLAAIMVTYPSTHGVFEESIVEICKIIHEHGGQVYMDGANLNAQVGLCRPGDFGVDVCHMNLHKTFCIPHGGGGPGVGPIAAAEHLLPFIPGEAKALGGHDGQIGPVCTAPFGSASILPISWAYIKMMGASGLKKSTEVAILNANYIAKRLEGHFDVLYKGENGFVGHECILDLRSFKRGVGIDVTDVAKRLMDYGFHAPTVSFPVIETMMVEPTESESLEELDRFCDAMIAIRREIAEVESGSISAEDSVLKNAPHPVERATADEWPYKYSREKAVFPLSWVRERKFWPSSSRIDNTYGDRNLFCSCIPLD